MLLQVWMTAYRIPAASAIRRALTGGLTVTCLSIASSGVAQVPAGGSASLPLEEEPKQPAAPVYDPTQPTPSGYVVRQRPRRGMVISGAALFGAGYGLGVLGYAESGGKMDIEGRWLLVPGVGPLLAMASQTQTCSTGYTPPKCEKEFKTTFVLANIFAMQAIGATLFVFGTVRKETRWEPASTLTLRLSPASFGMDGYGMAALGAF